MFRSTILTISALGIAATASGEEFELKFTYDSAVLASTEGAEQVMTAIETEATAACTTEKKIAGKTVSRTDRSCIKDITAKLVMAINAPTLEAAYEGSDYFVPQRRRLQIASR